MKFVKLLFFVLLGLVWNVDYALSWGKIGHRIVGGIADKELSSATKLKVSAIIGNETLAMISNYPDFLKSDPKFRIYNSYHYINEDLVGKHKSLSPKDKHILNGIDEFFKMLKEPTSSRKQKRMALSFLVHLIGDLHQPLHVGHKKDKGGNDISLKWFGEKISLHQLWDESLIRMQELSYSEYISFLYKTDSLVKLKVGPISPKKWALESKEYLPKTYKFQQGLFWEYKYNFDHIGFLNERLFLAGKRLALMLNSGL